MSIFLFLCGLIAFHLSAEQMEIMRGLCTVHLVDKIQKKLGACFAFLAKGALFFSYSLSLSRSQAPWAGRRARGGTRDDCSMAYTHSSIRLLVHPPPPLPSPPPSPIVSRLPLGYVFCSSATGDERCWGWRSGFRTVARV